MKVVTELDSYILIIFLFKYMGNWIVILIIFLFKLTILLFKFKFLPLHITKSLNQLSLYVKMRDCIIFCPQPLGESWMF